MTWTEDEKSLCKERYGCSILKVSCSPTDAEDRSLPTDAFLVEYIVDDVTHYDITRTQKESKLFDMYYDKYGKGSVQRIDFGYGTVNPKLWGAKAKKEGKKRK